jgi:hypothetical protein
MAATLRVKMTRLRMKKAVPATHQTLAIALGSPLRTQTTLSAKRRGDLADENADGARAQVDGKGLWRRQSGRT